MIIPAGFAEVTFRWQTVAGYRQATSACAFSISGWDEDVEAISDLWFTLWDDLGMPAASFANGVVVKVGTSNPSAPLTYEDNRTSSGTGTPALNPPNGSVLFTKRTLLGGRKGRGRMFFPPPGEANTFDTGVIGSGPLVAYQADIDAFISAIAALLDDTDPAPYLLHSDPNDEPTEITSITVESTMSSQRRRMVRN